MMKQLLVLAPLTGALAASPLFAQDAEWDEDGPLIHEFVLNFDRQLRDLDEELEGLEGALAFNFNQDFVWKDEFCDEGEDCDVRIIVKDGKRVVIVDGDTVETDRMPFKHPRRFSYSFGPEMHFKGLGPDADFHRHFDGFFERHRDAELRRLEREAKDLARKAREAEDADRSSLETELDKKLNEIFDYKLQRQQELIAKAEEHVEKLKESRSKRETARDEIIQNRKDELLGRDKYLEW